MSNKKPLTPEQLAFVERQAWIDAIQRRKDLAPAARLIGGRLGWHKNLITGQCNPGYITLANESGYPERTAIRAIAELENKGCIQITRTRGGSKNDSNNYILIPQKDACTPDMVSGVPLTSRHPCHGVTPDKSSTLPLTPCQANYLELGEAPKKEPLHKGEREEAELALGDPAPARDRLNGSAPGFKDDAPSFPPEEGKEARKILPTKEEQPAAATVTAYDELRAIWKRGHISDERADRQAEDRRAYDRACRKAAPDQIFAGALVWAQAADNPRYLPTLATFLDAEGWSKAPPERAARAPRQQRQPRRRTNGGKVDIAAIFFEQAGLTMDDEAVQ